MNAFKRLLVIVLVLILTNVGTYLFARWQCGERLEGQQALQEQASQRTQAVEADLAAAEEELTRLRVWGDFIAIQQDLNRVNEEINQLNFGNALDGVDEIIANLEAGSYGGTFREHRSRLLPLLMEAKQALRNRSDTARTFLVRFNEAAFTILSGLGSTQTTTAPAQPAPSAPEASEPAVPLPEAGAEEPTDQQPDAPDAAEEEDGGR